MKMVANPAREVRAMRQCFTTPRVEQVWASVLGGLFEAFVVAGVDSVVRKGSRLVTRWMRIPAGLVETAAVVVLAEPVENEIGSAVELGPPVSVNLDVEKEAVVTEMG